MKIFVDIHEPQFMIDYLRDLGWEVIVKDLKVGDYVRGDAALERKAINDFVSSLTSGRLWHQLAELKQYPHRYLGVVGRTSEIRKWRSVKPFLGAYARVGMSHGGHGFGIPPLRADNDRELAYIIHSLFKDVDEKSRPQEIVQRHRHRKTQEVREDMLSTTPGIGLKMAQKVLGKDGSIEDVVKMGKENIIEILGKSKGQKLCGVLFR